MISIFKKHTKIKLSSILAGLAISALSTISFANDYKEVKNPQPTNISSDKVLVQQFLWNKCIHCYNLEPYVAKWEQTKPSNIVFERIPVGWGPRHLDDGSYLNYAKVLEKTKQITPEQLDEINIRLFNLVFVGKQDLNPQTVFPIFESYKVVSTLDEFKNNLKSFITSTERSKSEKLTKAYDISGVPVFIVDGKYIFGLDMIKEGQGPEVIFDKINKYAKDKK